jgi:hypothetical protein
MFLPVLKHTGPRLGPLLEFYKIHHADFYNYITELEAAFVNHFDEALNSAQVGQFLLNVCRTFRLFTLALNFPSVLPFVCL